MVNIRHVSLSGAISRASQRAKDAKKKETRELLLLMLPPSIPRFHPQIRRRVLAELQSPSSDEPHQSAVSCSTDTALLEKQAAARKPQTKNWRKTAGKEAAELRERAADKKKTPQLSTCRFDVGSVPAARKLCTLPSTSLRLPGGSVQRSCFLHGPPPPRPPRIIPPRRVQAGGHRKNSTLRFFLNELLAVPSRRSTRLSGSAPDTRGGPSIKHGVGS